MRVNPKKYDECYVPGGAAFPRDIKMAGMPARNRALEGDLVAVLLDKPEQFGVMEQDALRAGIRLKPARDQQGRRDDELAALAERVAHLTLAEQPSALVLQAGPFRAAAAAADIEAFFAPLPCTATPAEAGAISTVSFASLTDTATALRVSCC